jgi:hypothetical protein
MKNAYKILVGNPEEKRPLGKLCNRWEDNIKTNIRQMPCEIWTSFNWLNIGFNDGLLER